MQNWGAMQTTANYDQHNNWYNSMFAAQIKTEPATSPSPPLVGTTAVTTQLEHYLNMKQQQHTALDTAMALSPSNNDNVPNFFDTNVPPQQQPPFIQQQQQHQHYQQQFQAAQQAAAQSQTTPQMPLGFNPLTPPGLPSAVLPPMPHFYSNMRQNQHTPSPHSPISHSHLSHAALDTADKLHSALTPRNTPPMDITPPKSPKIPSSSSSSSTAPQPLDQEKDNDLLSNSSEDMKYMGESEDDESIRMPIYNSHGKMKNYKCKSCGLVAITKIAFWEHARSHMKPEKILQCPKCPFVTELKHHLEYHIRKHKNLKPFQCDKCSYSCVNKSMLNSHRKSHSSVYQYRCANCDYATKYCHSFKLHLRKYDHKPGMVLDEEGIPNPSVVIDVYGTRRGPKSKSGSTASSLKRSNSSNNSAERHNPAKIPSISAGTGAGSVSSQLSAALQGFTMPQHQMPASPAKSTSSTASEVTAQQQLPQPPSQQPTTQQLPNLLSPLATIMQQNRNMAFFPYWNLNLQMLAAQQQAAVLAQLSPGMRDAAMQNMQLEAEGSHTDDENEKNGDEEENDDDRKSVDSAMDLTQGSPTKEKTRSQQTPEVAINLKLQEETSNSDTPLISSGSSRRKGRVLKLETLNGASAAPDVQESSDAQHSSSADESMEVTTGGDAPAATSTPPAANTSANSTASSSGNSSSSSNGTTSALTNPLGNIYECKYCDIYFKDAVLYTIHMGYHSCDDVFKCNMCGEKCDGPVGLFVHMARNAHS